MNQGVLGRRVEQLLSDIKAGKVRFLEGNPTLEAFARDLAQIKRHPDGTIDLTTCTPLVRQLSRSFVLATKTVQEIDPPEPPEVPETPTPKAVEAAQREYFALVGDFFLAATGTPADRFEETLPFGDRILSEAHTLAPRFEKAFGEYIPRLQAFYGAHASTLLGAGKLYSGFNAVVGGASNFPNSAFDGYRKMALYADTVFVPDPVLPWIEDEREHEGFRHVRLLEACHDILRLRPLADAKLPYPAVVVFPSWEKSLEANDGVTQDGIGELSLSFFNHFLEASFDDESDVLDHVKGKGREEFRRAVNRHGLLVPLGANGPMSIDDGVKSYLDFARWSRTPDYVLALEQQPPEAVAWLLIMERLAPQFHIRDNARALHAQPLLWNPAHYHYFNLCATATAHRLEQEKVIDPKTVALLAALNKPALAWLGNVPVNDLVRLREANANEKLRKSLAEHLKGLAEADETNLNRVAAEVARGLASIIAEHSKEADKLWQEHKKKLVLGGGLVFTGGIALSPWLAGLLGLIPGLAGLAAGAGAVLKEFVSYRMDRSNMSQSVVGILSSAKAK